MAAVKLGVCPQCNGPRKYTEELTSKTRYWQKCPNEKCSSHKKAK